MNDNSKFQTFPQNIAYEFGERVKIERVTQGLTQQELADLAGLSKETVYRFENEKLKNGSLESAYAIAFALKVEISDLLPEIQNQEIYKENSDEIIKDLFEIIKIVKKIIKKIKHK